MPTEKKLTGYPSIDRPQERFYRENPVRKIDTHQTIYNLVFDSNRNNMLSPALEYMGVTWTFQKLKYEADRASDAFVKSGLKLGDTVLIGVSNCPEAITTLLALNKIGVVSKWFDIRSEGKDIVKIANSSKCRYLIAFDMLLPKIQPILDDTCIEKVLVLRPTDSLCLIPRIIYTLKAKQLPKDVRYLKFKDFVKNGDASAEVPCVSFDKARPSIMIQSSGTTGKPKTIVHSDFSATSCAQKVAYADLPIEPGKELLVLLPPWIAYSLGNAIIYPLSMGAKLILSPTFEPEMIIRNLGKFTICFTAPICYRYLQEKYKSLNKKQKEAVEKIECLVSGGDKITIEENISIEKSLDTVLVNGWGDNEGWGCLSVNPIHNNKYGTVGIPKYGETIISFDNDTQKELPYGKVGEICVLADTTFLYYEGNLQETALVKRIHSDEKTWLHTGDLGFIDEEGFITLCGRARRVITRRGFKISAYTIEDKICEHPAVKECVAVEVKDEEDEHVPMVYIVLKDEHSDLEMIEQNILHKCISELKEYEVPKYLRIVPSLPYTQNGKYDFRLLENQGNTFVDLKNNKKHIRG